MTTLRTIHDRRTPGTSRRHSFLLKACPRCRGDLTRERDIDQDSYVCIQCGWRGSTLAAPVPLQAVERAREPRPVRRAS